jgi:3-deoxy-manno-octulosonate cytidylyltransferase (CMP-KDO synthetase)
VKKVVFIPVRYASTRLPGKPLVDIAGKPMVRHVYERVCEAQGVDEVIVATDDGRIAEACKLFDCPTTMTAVEQRCGTDRIKEAADNLGLSDNDIIVNVQGDQPLIPHQTVEEVIAPLTRDDKLGMSTLAVPMSYGDALDPVNVAVVLDNESNALYFSRAVLPFVRDEGTGVTYLKHLGIYAYRKWFLDLFSSWETGVLEDIEKLEMLRVLEQGHKIKVAVTTHDSIEVDRPEDVVKVEKILRGC